MAGWGGSRPGAGKKKQNPANRPRLEAKPRLVRPEPKVTSPQPAEVAKVIDAGPAIDPQTWMEILPQVEAISKAYAKNKARTAQNSPFRLPKFPKAALPPESVTMAMDSALCDNLSFANQDWLAGEVINGVTGEGLLFLGYSYLSELAQRPEYRVMAETIADDATRKWIDFDVVGDAKTEREKRAKDPEGYDERMADPDERQKRLKAEGKLDKVKAMRDDQLRLCVKDRIYEQCRNDGFFGRSHLFLDIHTNGPTSDDELKMPIGDGRDSVSKSKVPKGSFKDLRTIEPVWTYPLNYNANDPLAESWYNPQVWYVMGKEIHGSRLQTFIGHPVPDMLKPAYAFGGLSLTQMAKPYVDIWLQTRQSVADLIHSFSVMVLMTDLSTLMQPGNVGALLARAAMFNMLRDNNGLFVANKNTEDFKNVSASLSGLHELQSQAQEHMASVHRIPLVKFTGIQPAGLNASSEGEIKVYDDTIMAYQSRFIAPNLTKIINFEQLSLFGEIDPAITYKFMPLREMTQAEKGQKEKDDADRNQKYVDMGALHPGEVRAVIINDPDLPYTELDPDDVPDLLSEEQDGLEPVGGRPQEQETNDDKGGGANDAADPFGATDAAWSESDHPRAPDGKFGKGGGASTESGKATTESSGSVKPIDPKALKRVGDRLGSNEGGTFEDESGNRFYIKRPATKAHVDNELAAARLYKLAGVETLDYRPVAGGNHVATAWENLDKNRVSNMTAAERAEAVKDFAVHAWLANWDAAGTGGDNQGVRGGKPVTLDVGGSLRFRAQGSPKGNAFGDKVSEIDTLRDPKVSPDAAALFGKMTDGQIRESVSRVTSIPDAAIRKAVGGDEALADQLVARKRDLAARFDLQAADEAKFEESKHPRDPDGKFASGGGSTAPSPVKTPAPGKASAFGGLYKHTGKGEKADHEATVDYFLAKPAKHGSSYRSMLKNLIENAAHFGTPKDKVEKLKSHLAEAWANAAKEATAKAATLHGKEHDEALKNAEKAQAKAKTLGWKGEVTTPPEPAPAPPPKVELPKPTAKELEQAKKSTKLQLHLVPGDKPTGPLVSVAQKMLDESFNDKYAGKTLTDPDALAQKVADFKAMQQGLAMLAKTEKENLAQLQAEAKAKAAKEAKEKAAKAAEEAKRQAEKNQKVMAELGISEKQAEGVVALAKMLGSSTGELVETFKTFEKQAESLGYPISGFQCALIKNYSDGGYHAVNQALRAGAWTPAQHMYVSMVNKALDKMPKYKGVVKRGTTLTAEQIAQYKEGHIVQDNGFMSSSTGKGFSGNVRYTVTAHGIRASSIEKLSHYPGEKEVLFQARTFFKVNKVTKEGGVTHIEMEEWEEH